MKRHNIINQSVMATGGILAVMLVVGTSLAGTSVLADESMTITTSITVPIACTMTGTGTVHAATLNPGTYSGASGSEYQNGIGKTTLTAICNDDNGFSIYAVGYTGDSMTGNNTKLIGSSTQGMIDTKAYASGDTASNWSMKVTKVTDSTVSYNPANMSIQNSFDSWHVVPSSYTKVAQYHANTGSSTTDTTLGAKVETTYAAYIAANQSADIYEGQVKYTLVHPYDEEPLQPQVAEAGCIRYYPNGGNVVGTMGCQSISNSATSATLLASNFSRTGYGFAGWSNKYDYATNPNQEGIKFYGPQEDIAFTAGQYTGSNPGLSLYAVWVKSNGSLQDASKVAAVCNNLTQAPTDGTANLTSVSALTDQRDNETYAIARLSDGNCWMIENLRLGNTATDNTNGSLAQGYNASFIGLANPEVSWAESSKIANSLYSTDGSTDMTISGSLQALRFPRYSNVNTPTNVSSRPVNPTTNSATNNTSNASMYNYGNYYTWAATIADTTARSTSDQSVTDTSICPFGWRLPRGGSKARIISDDDNEFWTLIVTYLNDETLPANYDTATETGPYYTGTSEAGPVSNALRAYPNNFIYSGDIHGGRISNRGSYGTYWSSTANSTYGAFVMGLGISNVYPGATSNNKYSGNTIRCVASGT